MRDQQPPRPYLMDDWPKSDGRTFLAHAFAFFCMLEWGCSFEEMDAALDPASQCDPGIRFQILGAAKNFGRVLQQGRIETFARPFGGGAPRPLSQEVWELDEFTWRFGTAAIDPADPFNREAPPTHWIFVHTDQFDEILGLVQDVPAKRGGRKAEPPASTIETGPHDESEKPSEDRYLRKAEVLKLVPMSRSTLDDRVRKGLFPKSVDLGGGIVVWWESEIHDWMRAQTGRS